MTTISPTTLIDVNWSVRLVAASSTAAALNEPRVLLQLRLLDKNAAAEAQNGQNDDTISQSKVITVELNQSELAEFITKLKQTRATMFALAK